MRSTSSVVLVWGVGVGSLACSSAPIDKTGDESTGELSVALTIGSSRHDVAGIDFKVVPRGAPCERPALQEQLVSLQGQTASPELLGDGAGALHPFADGLFVLPSGKYTLCGEPVGGSGQGSSDCAPTSKNVAVHAGTTTEVVLVSQCKGDANGALDAVVALNDPPRIDDLEIGPSKFIGLCQEVTLEATASDPNGDELRYDWKILTSPPGPAGSLSGAGSQVRFTPGAIGDYELELQVHDTFDLATSLTFPIHVDSSCIPATADTTIRTDVDARRNDNYGCQQYLEIGNSRGGGGTTVNGPDAIRTLIDFDVSGLPSVDAIESAVLELTVEDLIEEGPPSVFRIMAHPITATPDSRTPWQEGNGVEYEAFGSKLFDPPAGCVDVDTAGGVAWATGEQPDDANNQALPYFEKPWSATDIDSSSIAPGDVVRVDLTFIVRAWLKGTLPNLGIMLTDPKTTDSFRTLRFGSRDAKLRHYPDDTASPPRWRVVDGPRLVITPKP